jgi:hypothetical protein
MMSVISNPLPKPLPMIGPHLTFPVLRIDESTWLNQWRKLGFLKISHFALISLDDLVQVVAEPNVIAQWG